MGLGFRGLGPKPLKNRPEGCYSVYLDALGTVLKIILKLLDGSLPLEKKIMPFERLEVHTLLVMDKILHDLKQTTVVP